MPGAQFVTFEGIEGSGKTTQVRLLERWLRQRGVQFVSTREPGGTTFGLAVRAVLLDPAGACRAPMSELLLYLADRYQDLHEIVLPALESNRLVLCDRYHDATVAYQGFGRGLELSRIRELERVLGIRKPDLTFLFDLDADLSLKRARVRNSTDRGLQEEGRFEQESLAFHRAVRQGYLNLAAAEPKRFAVINASLGVEEIHERVVAAFESYVH